MAKKKVFGVSQTLSKGIRETIHAVENNIGNFRFAIIPITQIELDPDNPRDLLISAKEVADGLDTKDHQYEIKKRELDNLIGLSESIKLKGIINPIVVYKYLDKYRIVAGERRFLASLYGAKQDVQARILNEKPTNFDLRLIQWIENTEREDLSLKDRIGNVKAIIREYQFEQPAVLITATRLKEIMGISLPQASYYFTVVNAKEDVNEAISNGLIKNLDKAAIIAGIENEEIRKKAIEACKEGLSLKQLRSLIHIEKTLRKRTRSSHKSNKLSKKISMGETSKSLVVKKIVDTMLQLPEYQNFNHLFVQVDWNEFKQVSYAFRELIKIIENHEC